MSTTAKKEKRPAADVDSNWKVIRAALQAKAAKRRFSNGEARASEVKRVRSERTDATTTTVQSSKSAIVGLDCEMVGVGDGRRSALARVSLVGGAGEVILDEYVKPDEEVVDYRTKWSGIQPFHIRHAPPQAVVVEKVKAAIANKIVVGHDLRHDFKALGIQHPPVLVRDTARYRPFQTEVKMAADSAGRAGGNTPRLSSRFRPRKLKDLAIEILREPIQHKRREGHDSVVDARTCVKLYLAKREEWERALAVAPRRKRSGSELSSSSSSPSSP